MMKIKENGGLIAQYKVESLSELSGYDIVINCTGLGSRELVGDKHSSSPGPDCSREGTMDENNPL